MNQHLTKDEFLDWFPQFESVDNAWLERLIRLCRVQFSRHIWGGYLNLAEAYFIAHMVTMRELLFQQGEDGEIDLLAGAVNSGVTNFRAGDVSYSTLVRVSGQLKDSQYERTAWGQLFLDLKKKVAVGLVMVT